MSSTVDLVKKKSFVRINRGNCPNKTIHEIRKNEMDADLDKLNLIKKAHLNNPIIGYLNLNSFKNIMHEVREVFRDLSLNYFVPLETKINDEFPGSVFIRKL